MGLSVEDKKEVEEIVKSVMQLHQLDVQVLQQQWRKFKEAPEARLAALEVQTSELGREIREFKQDVSKRFEQVDKRFEQVDKRFEQVDKRFEQMRQQMDDLNKTMMRLHESMNAQVWKFLGGLGVILILLRLSGSIFPNLP
ncbi:MAG: hypothetical protein HQM11_17915 [SAR324 cluster bacterium]|nr:hypothetical protein [SAR324 cluster bacterium]